MVIYQNEEGNEILQIGKEIPESMRAVSAFIKTLIERWDGPNLERLKTHYGLFMSVKYYLPENLYENSNMASEMKYLMIKDFIKEYVK